MKGKRGMNGKKTEWGNEKNNGEVLAEEPYHTVAEPNKPFYSKDVMNFKLFLRSTVCFYREKIRNEGFKWS